jgi:peptide/nickel transport system permease protein
MTGRGVLFFLTKRVFVLFGLLIVVSFGIFSLLHAAPGDPVTILLGENARGATPETIRLLRHEHHLDKPFFVQYWIWAKDAVQLDFGDSSQTTLPVSDEIRARLPVSLFLGIYAFVLTATVGIAFGVAAAMKKHMASDRAIVAVGVVGLSTPVFVSGILLLYVFGIVLHWFPVFGKGNWFVDELWHLTLPAVALAIHSAAYLLKHTRAAMIGTLDQDYVVFARARGLSARRTLFLYALRNALIPIVTISGIMFAFLIVGAVLVEVTFSLSGVGDLLVQAATHKDLPMLQGVGLVIATVIIVVNLLADAMYALVDPRIRLGQRLA